MIQIKSFTFNILGTNCYVLWDDGGKRCVIVDPGMYRDFEEKSLLDFLETEGLTPDGILLTHGHFDHTWGVAFLVRRFACPVYMSSLDRDTARMGADFFEQLSFKKQVETFDFRHVADGEHLCLGGVDWTVITCPGRSPGGVCYHAPEAGILVSGNSLFAGAIGRTDLPGSDYDALMQSLLKKVMLLPGDTDVLPGHGARTSIAAEAATNPFLIPFNDPDDAWWEQDGLSIHRT